jgi:MFS family permease
MEAKLIEKLDRRRYKYLLWATIGYFISSLLMIVAKVIPDQTVQMVIALSRLPFVILFFCALFMLNNNRRIIAKTPGLQKAINNELYKFYGYKSLQWAFIATIITTLGLLVVSGFATWYKWEWMTVSLTCYIVLFVILMTFFISNLIYLRR